MHYSSILALAAASAVSATTIKVDVGKNGLTYTPNDITAAVGDAIEFSFFPKNHSVTQSSFADPCHPLAAGGFFSGFVPTAAPGPSTTTFTITVADTKPIWIYCGQTVGNHCQSGMVAAINAPKTGNTLGAFTLKAKNATTSTSPEGGPKGGVLNKGGNGTSTASGTGTATSASTGGVAPTSSSAGNTAAGPSSSPTIVPASGAEKMGVKMVGAFVAVLAVGFTLV